MKIIGLDPGFAALGWVHCEWNGEQIKLIDGGVIVTKPDKRKGRSTRAVDDNLRRTRKQARELVTLFDGASLVCMEAFNLGPKGTRHSAAKQGGSSATIAAVCECLRLPLLQATPQEIKKATMGRQKASKDEVRVALAKLDRTLKVVLARIGDKGKREHCADAFGSVVACLDTEEARLCLAATASSTSPR